jgi:hypothetical protein
MRWLALALLLLASQALAQAPLRPDQISPATPNITWAPGGPGYQIGTTVPLNTQAGNSAYTVVTSGGTSDAGKVVLRTNTTTQTDVVPSAVTAGNGFGFSYQTGTVGNTVSATPSVNGLATIKIGPNQTVDFYSDGVTWRAVLSVPQPATQAGGTFLRDDMTFVASGGGSGTPIVFAGTTAGTATAQTLATPTPSGFSLTDQYIVRAKIGAGLTNTGPTTLSVAGTTATSVVRQTAGTNVTLAGGELVAGAEYDFVYNAAGPAWVVTTNLATAVSMDPASGTVTQAQWANGQAFVYKTSGKTLTLPAVSTTPLATNSGIVIQTIGAQVTLAPAAADGINARPVNTPVTIPPDMTVVVTTTGVGGVGAFQVPLGPFQYAYLQWAVGMDLSLSTAGIRMVRFATQREIYAVSCINDTAGASQTIMFKQVSSAGTMNGAGTNIVTAGFNQNTTAGTETFLTLTATPLLIPANYYIGVVSTGSPSTTGAGFCQVTYR